MKCTNIKVSSLRQLAIADAIREAISTMIINGDVYHPILERVILSFAYAQITADFKIATVFVSSIDQHQKSIIMPLLRDLTPMFRKLLAKYLRLRYTPELKFLWDETRVDIPLVDKLPCDLLDE